MHKLSESLQFYEKFLTGEQEYSRKFYGGRWVIFIVLVRFINQVADKLLEKSEAEEEEARKEGLKTPIDANKTAKDGPSPNKTKYD